MLPATVQGRIATQKGCSMKQATNEGRRVWQRPALTRLAAAKAENGAPLGGEAVVALS